MIEQVGPYQVSREIGRGGMGLVYLATDTRLDRQVAIKALPQELAQNADRLARFEREAKTLASLTHPNLAGIYGVEEHEGARYLVLEYVEGQTLADMLDRGPLPVEDAIEYAVQIAAGVEAAHEAGVIHRDLKPGNIIITPDGKAKVLDFGLARVEETSSSSTGGMSESPTLTSPAIQHSPTMPGVILGTAAYMSPEQARGRRVDKRTDIWSFGVLLYEMLVGASPFVGETVTDSIGAILHKDVPFDRLPAGTPANVRRVLRRCLERDKHERYRDIGDVALDLRATDGEAGLAPSAPAPSRARRAALLALAFLLGAAVIAGAMWLRPSAPAPDPPALKRFGLSGFNMPVDPFTSIAISPTADSLVVRSREPGGEVMLRVRPMDSLESRTIPGSESGWLPFYSPDGRRVGFFALGEIRVASVSGGEARTIARTNVGFTGGAWMDDGSILFTGGFNQSAVFQVPSSGGEVQAIETLLPEGADYLAAPMRVPGADAILCVVGRAGRNDIGVFSRADGRVRILAENGFQPVFAASGHVIYQRTDNGPLMALPFDAERLVATGPPFELQGGGGRPSFQTQLYAIAADGAGEVRDLQAPGPNNLYAIAATADDAQVLLAGGLGSAGESVLAGLSLLDVEDGQMRPASDGGLDLRGAVLSPDNRLIAYASMQSGESEVYLQPWPELDERVQVSSDGGAQPAWSRDGSTLFYRRGEAIYAADVQYDDELVVSRPAEAIEAPFNDGSFGLAGYEPDDEGGFIAVRSRGGEPGSDQIEVVLNYFTEIERRDPSRQR